MDFKEIRAESIQSAKDIDVNISSSLPLLDDSMEMRDKEEIVVRILTLHVIAAAAFGFDRVKAIDWLDKERITGSLNPQERRFISEGVGAVNDFKVQIEGMWALAWALGIVELLDFTKYCDNRFVEYFPNIKLNESSKDFRSKIKERSRAEVIKACDLAYCLHWAIRQAEITNEPSPFNLRSYVIIERRRALEWILGKEEWDKISLDT